MLKGLNFHDKTLLSKLLKNVRILALMEYLFLSQDKGKGASESSETRQLREKCRNAFKEITQTYNFYNTRCPLFLMNNGSKTNGIEEIAV